MPLQTFDKALAASLCEQSRSSPRRRAHHSLHASDDAVVHRLLVAMQTDSYVPPHRHLSAEKGETLVVLSGLLGYLGFDDAGKVISRHRLGPQGDAWAVDIPPGDWHCVVALMPDTLFFETKAGPYRPLAQNEQAPWAAAERSAESVAQLMALKAYFNV